MVDITDGAGFSVAEGEYYVSQFMSTTVNKNSRRDCDQVRASLVEYGTRARIVHDFDRFMNPADLEESLSAYSPGSSLGDMSNARAGLSAARLLITQPSRGHRETSTVTIFWLVKSTPVNLDSLYVIANQLKSEFGVQIVVVAVGGMVNHDVVGPIATNSAFFIDVYDIAYLVKRCHNIDLDYCPGQPDPTKPWFSTTTLPDPTTKPWVSTTKPWFSTTTQPEPTTRTTKPWVSTTKPWVSTTQPNPTTPQTTLPDIPVPADDFCFQCRNRRNQKDHYADDTDCHFFYQCFYFNETFAVGIRRQCPPGTYWRDSILACMPEGPIPCFDRCEDDATAAQGCYAGSGCSEFYVCANQASYQMCCPEGSAFNEATCSCEESETCFDTCVQQGPAVPTTVAPSNNYNATVCQDSFGTYISSIPGTANAFSLVDVDGNPTEIQYCPPGVEFSLTTCSCSIYNDYAFNPVVVELRQATLWLPFDNDLQDHSVHSYDVYAYDGAERDATSSAQGGASLAVQSGHLEVPGLKSFDFRGAASWCAFFR